MNGHVRTLLPVALAGLCSCLCAADSIKIGDRTLDDVYITENADCYFVRIPSDGSLETVSKKRTDVRNVEITGDPAKRGKLLQQWKESSAKNDTKTISSAPHARGADTKPFVSERVLRGRTNASKVDSTPESPPRVAIPPMATVPDNQSMPLPPTAIAPTAQSVDATLLPNVREYIETSQMWGQMPRKVQANIPSHGHRADGMGNIVAMIPSRHMAEGVQPMFFRDWLWVLLPGGGEKRLEVWDIKVGRIGYVEAAEIVQVIDGNSLLLRLSYNIEFLFSIAKPVEEFSWRLAALDGLDARDQMVIVRHIDTSGHVDGEAIRLKMMLKVAGTSQYTTATGGKGTAFALEPFDIEPFRNAIPASMLCD